MLLRSKKKGRQVPSKYSLHSISELRKVSISVAGHKFAISLSRLLFRHPVSKLCNLWLRLKNSEFLKSLYLVGSPFFMRVPQGTIDMPILSQIVLGCQLASNFR